MSRTSRILREYEVTKSMLKQPFTRDEVIVAWSERLTLLGLEHIVVYDAIVNNDGNIDISFVEKDTKNFIKIRFILRKERIRENPYAVITNKDGQVFELDLFTANVPIINQARVNYIDAVNLDWLTAELCNKLLVFKSTQSYTDSLTRTERISGKYPTICRRIIAEAEAEKPMLKWPFTKGEVIAAWNEKFIALGLTHIRAYDAVVRNDGTVGIAFTDELTKNSIKMSFVVRDEEDHDDTYDVPYAIFVDDEKNVFQMDLSGEDIPIINSGDVRYIDAVNLDWLTLEVCNDLFTAEKTPPDEPSTNLPGLQKLIKDITTLLKDA